MARPLCVKGTAPAKDVAILLVKSTISHSKPLKRMAQKERFRLSEKHSGSSSIGKAERQLMKRI
jgi:hypothetical protein